MAAFTVTPDATGQLLTFAWTGTPRTVVVARDAYVATGVPASPALVDVSGTTVVWADCTSPVAANRVSWIAAVGALFSTNLSLSGNLDVAGAVSLADDALVGGDFTVSGDANIVGVPRSIVQWKPASNWGFASGEGRRNIVGWDDTFTLGPDEAVHYTGQITFYMTNITTRYAGFYLYIPAPANTLLHESLVNFTTNGTGFTYQTVALDFIWAPGPGTHTTDARVQTAAGSVSMWAFGTTVQRRLIYWPAGKVQTLSPSWS